MAYQTGSATDLGDLLTKLDTFLVANGYTQDDFDDGATTPAEGFAAWHKGSVGSGMWISMKWVANAPNNLSLHQALGHTPSNDPGNHPNDSGNGYNAAFGSDALLETERSINTIGDGPFVSYHFFEQDSGPGYVHVVVEIESEVFRHFGWGTLEKFNDWTGGEYCYGHWHDEGTNSDALDANSHNLLDGLSALTASTGKRNATIHAEGLPMQGVNEKWLHHSGGLSTTSATFVDTAGETMRISFGGFRSGPVAFLLGNFQSDIATGHIPMYPLAIFVNDYVNDYVYFLGSVPDIRGIDITYFAPGQEITIGSDVWVVFPTARRTSDNVVNRTYFQGIAYKKVTA